MRILALIGFILLIATCLKGCANLFDNGINWDDARSSISSSRLQGVFVCRAQVIPTAFKWKNETVSFKDAWIERKVKTKYVLVWFSTLKDSGTYFLCFTLNQGRQVFKGWPRPFFALDGFHYSFGMSNGDQAFPCEISPEIFSQHHIKGALITKWKDPERQDIQFLW